MAEFIILCTCQPRN